MELLSIADAIINGAAAGAGSSLFELDTSVKKAVAFGFTYSLIHDQSREMCENSKLANMIFSTVATTILLKISQSNDRSHWTLKNAAKVLLAQQTVLYTIGFSLLASIAAVQAISE